MERQQAPCIQVHVSNTDAFLPPAQIKVANNIVEAGNYVELKLQSNILSLLILDTAGVVDHPCTDTVAIYKKKSNYILF